MEEIKLDEIQNSEQVQCIDQNQSQEQEQNQEQNQEQIDEQNRNEENLEDISSEIENSPEVLEETPSESETVESIEIKAENANTTNCLALTIQEDHKLVALKNVFLRSIRMSWKVAVSTITLALLKLFS